MTPEMNYRNAAVNNASWLCRHGIRVFPIQYSSKNPLAGKAWQDYATSNISEFVSLCPPGLFNLAMVFGPESGICDVEPDSDAAAETLYAFMRESGVRTVAYKSRRGIHHLFKWEPRLAVFSKANIKVKELECRLGVERNGKLVGQYSVCPPSLHPDTGEHYTWLDGCAPWEITPAPMPENLIRYFEENYRNRQGREIDVLSTGDGFLPGHGHRHDYLLAFSKSLYCDWLLPIEDCMELTRHVSQKSGSYYEEGRGETELVNLFKGLSRPVDPAKEMEAVVRMQDVTDVVETVRTMQQETKAGLLPEIPEHIFPPLIEEASQDGKLAQYPRNFMLMATAVVASYAAGQAVKVRASKNHDSTGLQTFAFGVGGSGSGKSKVMKAMLGPVSHTDAVTTEGSPEGLVSLMSRFKRGILTQFTEGKEFFKMLGKYGTPGQGSDNSLFHKVWSGDKIKRTLQKGTFGVEDPFMSVFAGIQAINLAQMPANDCLDGLMQRMLVFPLGHTPTKEDQEALARFKIFLEEWYRIVGRMETIKPAIGSTQVMMMASDMGVGLRPLQLTLDDQAFAVWQDYAAGKRSPMTMAAYPEDHPYRADLVRHAEIVLRLAGCLFILYCACDRVFWETVNVGARDEGFIPVDILKKAIDLMEWLWQQKQVLTEHIIESAFASVQSAGLHKAESLVTRMKTHLGDRRRRIERQIGEEWTLREYYSVFKLKKMDAQMEIDMFLREGHVIVLEMKENQKTLRYKFLGEE